MVFLYTCCFSILLCFLYACYISNNVFKTAMLFIMNNYTVMAKIKLFARLNMLAMKNVKTIFDLMPPVPKLLVYPFIRLYLYVFM